MFRKSPVLVVILLLSASTLSIAQTSRKTLASGQATKALPVTTHEKFATFLAGEDFKSVLLLENLRPDKAITFAPALILKGGEVPLESVAVPAHSTATVDINAALKSRGLSDTRGAVSVRFDFNSYGPGAAVVQMSDEKHQIFLNSYAQSAEEYWSGTDYDAVVWTPQDGTQGFIAITNASNETHAVRTSFLVNGRAEQRPELQIPARQTRMVPIDDLLSRSRKSGAGIHIEYVQGSDEEYPGAILVEGQIFNRKTGFTKRIHFMDKALPPTGTLRTQFLMIGRQPGEDGFPANMSFRSVAAIRNIDSGSVTVTPTVKFLQNGSLQTVTLPPRALAAGESGTIDFNEEQKTGRLPADFNQGSVELIPDTERNSIIGEMFNFSDSTGGFVIGPTFSSYPARSTASVWRTDGSFQTTIVAENTAPEPDTVSLRLYSDHSAYIKSFSIGGGQLLKINVRDLQQNAVPDDKGNLLTDTSGVVSLVGGHNTKSKLAYDKIIHSLSQSDYVGYTSSPCDYVTGIAMGIDFGSAPFPVVVEYDWSMSGPEDSPAFGSTVSDPSLGQITNNGSGDMLTLTFPNDGQVHEITINPQPSTQEVTFCDACSAGDENVEPASFSGRFIPLFATNCTTDLAGFPVLVASWGMFGSSCALTDTSPDGALPAGGKCESNAPNLCYDTSTPTCQKRYCAGTPRLATSDCSAFLDTFPVVIFSIPTGCH